MGLSQFDEKSAKVGFARIFDSSMGEWFELSDVIPRLPMRVDAVIAWTDSTTDVLVLLGYGNEDTGPGSSMGLAQGLVPLSSGDGTVPTADLLTLALPSSVSGLVFPGGYSLWAKVVSGLSTGAALHLTAIGGYL